MTKATGAGRGHRPGTENFLAAIAQVPAPPCDTCRHFQACAKQRLACDDFSVFIQHGTALKEAATSLKNAIKREEKKLKRKKTAESAMKYLRRFRVELEAVESFGRVEREPSRARFLQIMLGSKPREMSLSEWNENKRRIVGGV